jgi:hypothetical protein
MLLPHNKLKLHLVPKKTLELYDMSYAQSFKENLDLFQVLNIHIPIVFIVPSVYIIIA